MSTDLTRLAAVLEEEIRLGEELLRNLAAQKRAILAWNVDDLLQQIEARESRLRSLRGLEKERLQILKDLGFSAESATLRQLTADLLEGSPEQARWRRLREKTGRLFRHLADEERSLGGLLENLLSLIEAALHPLRRPAVPRYRESGAPEAQPPRSALIHSKA